MSWHLSLGIKFLWVSHFHSSQDAGATTHIYHLRYTVFCGIVLFFFLKSNTIIYHTVSNHQGQCKKWWEPTACIMRRDSLPWRHLRQFMRGSLRGGASQIQQTSSTPAATEANTRTTERGRGGEEANVKEEDRERAVNSINLCILIHFLATSLISVSPAPF